MSRQYKSTHMVKPHITVVYLLLAWHCCGREFYAVEELLYTFALYIVTTVLFYTVAFPRNQLDIIYNTRSLSDGLAKSSVITVAIHNKSKQYKPTQCCVTCVLPLFNMHDQTMN